MAVAPLVEGRKELLDFYETVCRRGYSKLRYEQRLEPEQNLLKSYLVEVHPMLALGGREERLGFLKRVVAPLKGQVFSTGDDTLFNIQRGSDVYHCDALHNRFWILHSNARAGSTDNFVDELARGTTALDVAWFPSEAMEEIAKAGQFLGFGSEYDPRPLFPLEEAAEQEFDGLILNVRRLVGSAAKDLEKLRRADMFGSEIGLSTMRVRFGGDGDFAIADVTHSGKFTARGPSFSAHQALISRTISIYEGAITSIEKELAIRWETSDRGMKVCGAPIGIRFRPYKQFGKLVERVFSGRRPFRLWGLPVEHGEEEFAVEAVDLHVGCVLRFDVSNGFIRAYLMEGGCGNTITRLFTNIQRHVDSRAVIMLGERTRAFGFTS